MPTLVRFDAPVGCWLPVLLILLGVDYVTAAYINVSTPFGVIEGSSHDRTLPDGIRYQVGLFLGIPYAKPPLGSLRFRKPVPKLSPGPFFQAHVEGQACPQSEVMLKGWVPGPADMSEDCLKLNVYVPLNSSCLTRRSAGNQTTSCPKVKKAVMVWIHGGANVIGQSRIYDAERLSSVGDIIVVTINYRLGALGFLSTGDGVVRGNAGLWDQQAAIGWVHENIASFGGDPARVTLAGESAGGASSVYQLLYPGNRGRIARVAVSSGTPLCPWAFSKESTAKYATRLAKRVGCNYDYLPGFSVERHLKMVRCLRSKPFQVIVNNSNVGSLTETLFRAEWIPTIDGEFLKEPPSPIFKWPQTDAVNSSTGITHATVKGGAADIGLISEVDAMVGSNSDDGEVVAKITVRNLINTAAGVDFGDARLTSDIIEKYYYPQIITDHLGKLRPDSLSRFVEAYQESVNRSLKLTPDDTSISPRMQALQKVMEATTDYEFLMPAVQTIASMADKKGSTVTSSSTSPRHFLFQFNRKYPNVARPAWNANAAHGDDLPYVFGFPPSMRTAFNITQEVEHAEWKTSKTVMTYWANFVKTGNPNTPDPVPALWSEFKDSHMNYLLISDRMTTASSKKNLFPERVRLWRNDMNNAEEN